jgi:hypothetical protein
MGEQSVMPYRMSAAGEKGLVSGCLINKMALRTRRESFL